MKKRRLLIIIILIASLILLLSNGWRLFGFKYCSSPKSLHIKKIEVTDERVNLSVINYSSAGIFSGYITKVENNNLYIGLKYSLFSLNRNGGSNIQIPISIKQDNIQKIYLKGFGSTVQIWDKEMGNIK